MMEIPLEKEAVFMDPTQTLELAQALKLSPTLLQSMNILQMTTLELSAYLKDLALENPVLEEQEGGTSWEEFAHQVSWLADQPGPSGGEAVGEPGRIDQETGSLSFLLEEQLDRLKLDQKILAVCRYLVGLLDDRGWLDPADLEGLTAAGVPEALLEQAVKTLQSLDPAGIGARNLGECLTLQLDRLPGDAPVARGIWTSWAGRPTPPLRGNWASLCPRCGRRPISSESWTLPPAGKRSSASRWSTSAPMPGWR